MGRAGRNLGLCGVFSFGQWAVVVPIRALPRRSVTPGFVAGSTSSVSSIEVSRRVLQSSWRYSDIASYFGAKARDKIKGESPFFFQHCDPNWSVQLKKGFGRQTPSNGIPCPVHGVSRRQSADRSHRDV